MTSEERREARYQRRKARRAARKDAQCALNDCFDWVFSYENLYASYKKCRRNVAWKASTQKYITQAPLNVLQTYTRLQQGKFKTSGFFEFGIVKKSRVEKHAKECGYEICRRSGA